MDFDCGNGKGVYCAYTETTDPILPDYFMCHHWYKQQPVSKQVKTHSFETGMPVYMFGAIVREDIYYSQCILDETNKVYGHI